MSRQVTKTFKVCFEPELFKNIDTINTYKCQLCDKICNDPCKMTCLETGQIYGKKCINETVYYGKLCLENYLILNKFKCPINNHSNAKYQTLKTPKKRILNSTVECKHKKKGCNWNGSCRKYINSHFRKCKYGRKKGHCLWFSQSLGYGFIQMSNGEDVFVHISALQNHDRCNLLPGEIVTFNVKIGSKNKNYRKKAINVREFGVDKKFKNKSNGKQFYDKRHKKYFNRIYKNRNNRNLRNRNTNIGKYEYNNYNYKNMDKIVEEVFIQDS